MAIYDFFLSRTNGPTVDNYVGHAGRLFYDPAERVLRISDGTTAGGEVFNGLVTVTNLEPTDSFQGQIWLNPEDSSLSVYHNGNFIPTIDVATETKLGGIKLGPGVTVNGEGQLIIDSDGLDFSFGDFAAITGTYAVGHPDAGEDYALLSSVNDDEDIIFASNGSGIVKVIGDFSVRTPNGGLEGALLTEPIFRVSGDGQVRMLVPLADEVAGALEIIGNDTGTYFSPNQTGVIVHVTGNSGLVCRNYFDANANYAILAGRRYNGTDTAPRRVVNNETILRLVAQASVSATSNGDATFNTFGPARISFYANEDQTPTAQGGRIAFEVTKNGFAADGTGTNTITAAYIDAQNGITATEFNGPLTGDVTGNVTGNVSGSAGSVAAANITGTTLASGVTGSSLTSVGTLTNLAIATGGTITTPRVVINDGGIRSVNSGTALTIDFAVDSLILWTAPSGTATVTLSNYTAGATVKLIIALTTSRDINFGVAAGTNSSTGSASWNGAGGGAIDISNTALHLDYTCFTGLAAGCYVAVTAN